MKTIFRDWKKITIILAFLFFLLANYLKVISFVGLTRNWPLIISSAYRAVALFILIVIIYLILIRFKRPYLFIGFYFLQALYIVINLTYYSYYHLYLNLYFALPLLGEGVETVAQGGVPWHPRVLIVLIDLPFFILLLYFYKKFFSFRFKLSPAIKILTLIWLILWGQIIFLEADRIRILFIPSQGRFWDETFIVKNFGTLANSLAGLTTYNVQEKILEKLDYGEEFVKEEPKAIRYNIVLIQIEAMGANIVNNEYKGNYIMPFLSKLSQENIYFPYTYSYHSMGGTSDAEFSILNSTPSFTKFPAAQLRSYDYPNSILKVFDRQGYETAAFHGNNGDFFNRDVAFQKYGFDNFYDIEAMGLRHVGWGAPDEEVFNFVIHKLGNVQEPFFYYIITMSSHEPFTNVLKYYSNSYFDDIASKVTRDYFVSMNYVDNQLKRFVEYVRNNFPETYIFIYGDHTPRLKTSSYENAALEVGTEYAEFVPLIIVTPPGERFQEKDKAASFLDLAVTTLEASGVDFRIKSRGENLLGESLDKCIPFVKDCYSREYLFKEALSTKK